MRNPEYHQPEQEDLGHSEVRPLSRREFLETAIGTAAGVATASQLEAQTKITEKDWVMKPEQANAYLKKEIHPELDRIIRDPKIPFGIARRVSDLFLEIEQKKTGYSAMPAWHPRTKQMVAHIDYDPVRIRELLIVFVPALQQARRDYQKESLTQRDIELATGLIFAHERVHQELAVKNKIPYKNRIGQSPAVLEINARDEAQAWAVTILEMIRPGQKAGYKLPKFMLENSETLRKLQDNYNHPAWINAFRKNLGIF